MRISLTSKVTRSNKATIVANDSTLRDTIRKDNKIPWGGEFQYKKVAGILDVSLRGIN